MLLRSAVHKYCSAGTHLLGSGLAVVTLLVTLFVGRWFVKLPGVSLGVLGEHLVLGALRPLGTTTLEVRDDV